MPIRRMSQNSLATSALFVLMLASLGFAPAADAQCMIIGTNTFNNAPSTYSATKTFSGSPGAVICTVVSMGANGTGCLPAQTAAPGFNSCPTAAGPGCRRLIATITSPTASMQARFCQFDCGPCGAVRIDNSNGLPVELMDFSIENGDSTTCEERPPSESGD